MDRQLVNANAVIIAHSINPSVFTQAWLIENDVVRPAELTGHLVMSPQVVSVDAERFGMLMVPDRLQFTPKPVAVTEQAELMGRISRVVQLLPHTPYTALGINLTWLIAPNKEPFEGFLRRSFWLSESPLYAKFDQPDARCGVYLSMDVLGFRLKLDVKPVRLEQHEQRPELLQLAFNFHLDVAPGPEAANRIVEGIAQWAEARATAEEILSVVKESDEV